MNNLLTSVEHCTGLTDARLGEALARRAGFAPLSARRIQAWRDGSDAMPGWVERECVQWLVELWSRERAECGAARLWEVDRKYTRMLDQLTIAELMALLRQRAPAPRLAGQPRETG
jgi:hypothetical protein